VAGKKACKNAKIFGLFAENQETPGLAGGEDGIRTSGTVKLTPRDGLPTVYR